jgi:hypothetical protein
MSQRKITQAEREHVYVQKQAGQTLQQIAQGLNLSYACVRKWWRRGRDEGLRGLMERKRGRSPQGVLSQFSVDVRQTSLKLKREPKRWGANRVLLEMRKDASLANPRLPSRSRLYAYFRQHCSDCLNVWTKPIQVPVPVGATAVHEVWQVDHQEGHRLADQSIATVCNIRDPFGAAMIASQAFSVKTKLHWRKLTWEEVRQVLRMGFTE